MSIEVAWEREVAGVGLHNMTITGVEDLGMRPKQKGGEGRKVAIIFRMDDQKDESGTPVEIRDEYFLNLSPAAKLGTLIRDIGFTPASKTFNLDELIGEPIQGVVEHRIDPITEHKYANVTRIIRFGLKAGQRRPRHKGGL
jgi:hypothetical protein